MTSGRVKPGANGTSHAADTVGRDVGLGGGVEGGFEHGYKNLDRIWLSYLQTHDFSTLGFQGGGTIQTFAWHGFDALFPINVFRGSYLRQGTECAYKEDGESGVSLDKQ